MDFACPFLTPPAQHTCASIMYYFWKDDAHGDCECSMSLRNLHINLEWDNGCKLCGAAVAPDGRAPWKSSGTRNRYNAGIV